MSSVVICSRRLQCEKDGFKIIGDPINPAEEKLFRSDSWVRRRTTGYIGLQEVGGRRQLYDCCKQPRTGGVLEVRTCNPGWIKMDQDPWTMRQSSCSKAMMIRRSAFRMKVALPNTCCPGDALASVIFIAVDSFLSRLVVPPEPPYYFLLAFRNDNHRPLIASSEVIIITLLLWILVSPICWALGKIDYDLCHQPSSLSVGGVLH